MLRNSERPFGLSEPGVTQAHGLPDDTPGYIGSGRWMTYDELAAARGIDRSAAVKLAVRQCWPKERDRYRIARVLVAAEWTASPQREAPAQSDHAPATRADQARAAERSMWRDLVAQERGRADKAERECTRLLSIIDGLEARVATAEADADAERAKADALKARAEVAEADLEEQREQSDVLRKRIQEVKELLTGVLRSRR